ncbi:YtzC family protein [Aquibacillus koreensis]|uniref:YtzC family protein n=1 Tax=Aquibacillus koreensis TaxID=279446 RepID=A0A9X3WMY9_9BACI|nr:YtzC family protein [Aquibacillus koreensis]MCT2535830.1 YtzC family protein [Aquibacillus koreensis]MDC3420286.1 YtzC family protein [Aquibacillus koreensis]
MVATRESVDNIIQQANQCIENAEEQLDISNRNGYEINSEYSNVQRELANVENEIRKLMDSASHQQRDQLHRIHLVVTNYMNDMVLDHIQLNKYE